MDIFGDGSINQTGRIGIKAKEPGVRCGGRGQFCQVFAIGYLVGAVEDCFGFISAAENISFRQKPMIENFRRVIGEEAITLGRTTYGVFDLASGLVQVLEGPK